jgi:hypothetical protein
LLQNVTWQTRHIRPIEKAFLPPQSKQCQDFRLLPQAGRPRGCLGILIAFNTIEFWFFAHHAGQLGCHKKTLNIQGNVGRKGKSAAAGGTPVNSAN